MDTIPRHGRLFAALVAVGFRRWSTYRLAAVAGALANIVFGLVRSAIVTATIAAAGGTLAGYDAVTGPTYVWLTQALVGPVYFFAWNDLALRIRSGDIAVDLPRPVDPQLAALAADLGRAAYQLIPRGAPPLLVGALVTGLALPGDPGPYLLGVLSSVLAVGISFSCRWLVNLSAFWLLDLRGPMSLYLLVTNVLGGLVVPVHWFPGWLAGIAAVTPFPSMLQTPIDVITGRAGGFAALGAARVRTGAQPSHVDSGEGHPPRRGGGVWYGGLRRALRLRGGGAVLARRGVRADGRVHLRWQLRVAVPGERLHHAGTDAVHVRRTGRVRGLPAGAGPA
jgi:ABC-2 type transport system permease protein